MSNAASSIEAPVIIVMTQQQVRAMIEEAVRTAIKEANEKAQPAADPVETVDYRGAEAETTVSESTLRRAVQRGELQPINTGSRAVRFSRAELRRWQGK